MAIPGKRPNARIMNQSAGHNRNSSLLEKIIADDERGNRHRR